MLQEKTYLEILVNGKCGEVKLYIYPESSTAKLYEEDSLSINAPKFYLVEGCSYTYECTSDDGSTYQLEAINEIITHHRSERHKNEGRITTGIYVGTQTINVFNNVTHEAFGKTDIEIRSTKSDYETDYRQMLGDIAEYYTDLVLQQGAPVTQRLEIDTNTSAETLYQRFAFVKSLIESDAFSEAIHKIISNPIRKWTDSNIQRKIDGVKRFTRKNIREIVSSNDRINLSESYRRGIPSCLTSVPRTIEVEYKKDTIDNQENQFIKFVLRSLSMFCWDLKEMKNASSRLKAEAETTIELLNIYLENQFFRQISMPTHLNMNSPVLQRKEGYREILQSWLLFDLAAKLNWDGGDDVYSAGKKNVATLYEYWLFFKLLELISQFFDIQAKDKLQLVSFDSDKINLNLIQGKTRMVYGQQETLSRKINVAFYYNRTFSKVADDKDSIHKAGSWTMAMRPDYTLSLWPGEIDENEAERQDLITHIHFDAKYRLNKITLENTNCEAEDLLIEKEEQECGIYKRADLLKMHAYKDAIRRTSGAYILYPGTENKSIKGFHEVVPGLGAFSIRPGHWEEDSISLKQFIAEVKAHMLDRTSQREKMSYYYHSLYKEENVNVVMENMPEPVYENRDFLPDETNVIVAYYKSQEHLDWILQNHMYNMRAGDSKGSISLDDKLINARYLLLHNGNESQNLIKIVKRGPKIYTRSQLIQKGYPQYKIVGTNLVDVKRERNDANKIYLVFELFKTNSAEKELQEYCWNNLGGPLTYTTSLVSLISKANKKK
ncbi:MAG: DUF2357 domain-containing protein [Paludibacteraceae bacterium]|nr:DUF2357 domain-containing protein [Paludibacteraceae bacterium]